MVQLWLVAVVLLAAFVVVVRLAANELAAEGPSQWMAPACS